MPKKSSILCAGILLVISLGARAAEVIDRIVATVNRHVILQSDWEESLRYEAFAGGQPLHRLTAADRKAALDRLIDQELLREQARGSNAQAVPHGEVEKRIQEIRKQYPSGQTDSGWRAALARYGITEDGLKNHIAVQIELMRLVDAQLRPTVSIDSKSIESYYNQELLPELRQSGAKDVPLDEVVPKIKEVLTQRKMNQLLTGWLQNLRAGSEIHTEVLPPEAGGLAQ